MARTKTQAAKNIRSSITSSNSLTPEKLKESTSANVAVAEHVMKISTRIEQLSENEKKFFNELLTEVKKIPESTQEFQKQQKAIYENLIKASAIIRKEVRKETDDEKRKQLELLLDELKKRGQAIEKDMPRGPSSFKERLASQQFGGDPKEVEEKGYFGAMFAQSKRELFGSPKISFDDRVDAEEMVAGIEQIPSKSIKEKSNENIKATSILERSLKALLSEVTIIRKITEGSLIREKGGSYKNTDTNLYKGKAEARTPGVGLFTKEELGEKLGLSKSALKKKENNLGELEKKVGESGLIDLTKKLVDQNEEIKKDINTVADIAEKEQDINENLDRATDIDTDPTDEERFKTSGSDEETKKETFATPQSQDGGNSILKTLSSLAPVLSKVFASIAAVAAPLATIIGGLGVGLAIGDKLNTSVADGGSGTFFGDFFNYNVKKKSPEEELAEKNADLVAQQKGFASFEEMKANNRRIQQERISGVEKTKNNVANTMEEKQTEQQQQPQSLPPIINNNYNNMAQPQTKTQDTSVVLPVRTSDTSFIRYQDKRMTRIL
jgi:hypothetical protein